MQDKIQKIADSFVWILQEWLTEAEWAEMQKRNAAETDPLTCHSHDFCDANMAMSQAFECAGHYCDGDNEEDCKLWKAAWEAAMTELTAKVEVAS